MTTESTGSTGGASDLDLFESEATGQPVAKPTTIPDKYKGKSVEDIIQMHQNAEQLASRQGAELGQMRKYADALIDLKKPTTQTKEEHKPITVDVLLNDPEKALHSAVNSSELVKRTADAEARVTRLESNLAERTFVSNHPSFAEDMVDPSFKEWMTKNPVRASLGQAASQANYEAANNLWSMWEEHKELTGAKDDTKTQRKPKSVPSTVKSSPAENNTGQRIYSRAKIMELRMKVQQGDPSSLARWNDPTFQENLNKAYAEERVR